MPESKTIVRTATPADVPAIRVMLAERGDDEDAQDLQLVVDSVGFEGVVVAEIDGVVAATATLLDEQVRVGSVVLPAGQIEMVAADKRFEHRGFVRLLTQWCHDLSARRGHVVQVMIGIPNFYRQFGYAYAIPMHPWAQLRPDADLGVDGDPTIVVRQATAHDVPAMSRLQDALQANFEVAMPHQPECWGWLVERDGSQQWVAEADGAVTATARVMVGDDLVVLGEIAGEDQDAVRALIRQARSVGGPGAEVNLPVRPHVAGLAPLLGQPERPEWYYVRIPDPRALLDALRPELAVRLASSGQAGKGTGLISLWRSHYTFEYGLDGIGPISAGGPFQAPVSSGGSGLPEDALAAMVFGCGAAGLEERFPDAMLGRQAELMLALFPPQSADLLTYYLPA